MKRENGQPERDGDWGEASALTADRQQYHNWRPERAETVGQKDDAEWGRARQEETAELKDGAGWERAC